MHSLYINPEKTPISILFIDDNPEELDYLQKRMALVPQSGIVLHYVISIEEALEEFRKTSIDMILIDNQLLPNNDFRETVPVLRQSGYIGPVGVISTDIGGEYFQKFRDYGVDFRMGKDEIDPGSLRYILSEYLRDNAPGSPEDFL